MVDQSNQAQQQPGQQPEKQSVDHHRPAWKSFEFWLGQILVIVATVVGVYLAAIVGFNQAIDFEVFNEYMEEYDVATSLYEEAVANADYVDSLANKRLQEPNSARMAMPKLQLQQFVWTTMQYNPQTFELSATTINKTQRFYNDVVKWYGKISSGSPTENQATANKLLTLTAGYRENVLAPLAQRIEMLSDKLAEYDEEIVQ